MDYFDPSVLASTCNTKVFDFLTITEESLHDIVIPLELQARGSGGDNLTNGWISSYPSMEHRSDDVPPHSFLLPWDLR